MGSIACWISCVEVIRLSSIEVQGHRAVAQYRGRSRLEGHSRLGMDGVRAQYRDGRSGGDGRFGFDGLEAGKVSVTVRVRTVASCTIEGAEVGTTSLEVVLPARTGIAGRVLQKGSGAPVSSFHVEVRRILENGSLSGWEETPEYFFSAPEDGMSKPGSSFQSSSGEFELVGMEEGTYLLRIGAEGFEERTIRDLKAGVSTSLIRARRPGLRPHR